MKAVESAVRRFLKPTGRGGRSRRVPIEKGRILVHPLRRRYTLDELLSRVTKGNIHGDVSSGASMGREDW